MDKGIDKLIESIGKALMYEARLKELHTQMNQTTDEHSLHIMKGQGEEEQKSREKLHAILDNILDLKAEIAIDFKSILQE